MAKYLPLPDGSSLRVPDEMGYQEAMSLAQRQFPDLFGEAAPKKTGLMADIGSSVENLANITRTGIGSLFGDATEAAQAGAKREQAIGDKYAPTFQTEKITKPFEEGEYGTAAMEAVKGVPGAAAQLAPSIGQEMGLALAGRIGGGAVGTLFGPAGTAIGSQIGQYAVPLLVNTIQALGSQAQSKVQDQLEKGEKPDVSAMELAPYAAGNAALNLVGTRIAMPSVFKNAIGQKVEQEAESAVRAKLLKEAEEVAGRGTAKAIGMGVGKFAFGELPTEVLQDVIDRAAIGKPLADDDAITQYRSTALSMVLASPLGGGFGLHERAGARNQMAQEQAAAEAKAAAEAEAAKNTPEALTQLHQQFVDARQQMQSLNESLKEKPPKNDEEAKLAYSEKKAERDAFANDTFKPLLYEYNKRKDAIAAMHEQSGAAIEDAAAQGQPDVTQAVAQSQAPVPVVRLMDQYGQLRNKLDAVETQLSEAPDVATQKEIEAQRADILARMNGLAPLIQERGGVTDTEADFTKKLDAAEKKRKDLLQTGDFDTASKQADIVAAMQAKLPHFEELRGTLTQLGQTRDLFNEEPAQPETVTEPKFVNYAGKPVEAAPVAATKEEAAPITAPAPEPLAVERAQKVQTAQAKLNEANTALADAVKTKNPQVINDALFKVNEAGNEVSRTTEKQGQTLKPGIVLDLFDAGNLIRTAVANGDQQTLDNLVRHEDRTKLKGVLDENLTERQRLITAHEDRLDLGGQELAKKTGEPLRSVKRERADLFSQYFDTQQQALFKNGTYQDKELQDLYDKGGPAAVEYAVIADKVADLSKKVTTRQGRGAKSLYEQLVDLASEHEQLKAQLESGIAAPTMREKVAGVQAKLGKGETPAQRQMDASERYQLERRLTAVENKYKLAEGKVLPVRDQVQKLWDSLYVTTPLEKPSKVREAKKEAADAEAKGPKSMSRSAKMAARINAGDVRREAEASEKMRDLAKELGRQEPGYETYMREAKRRADALVAKYGKDDAAVKDFKATVRERMEPLAIELGKKTPEYKATLKEQIAYFKEVLPTAGEQKAPSKRTSQVTRKATNAPKEFRVAGSRMSEKEQEQIIQEAEKARPARGVETESPDLTKTQVQTLESGDLTAVLSDIANDKSNTALNRAVAQRLAALLDSTKAFVDEKLMHKGKEVLGWATSKEVHISRSGGLSQEVVLHEGTHAGAERVLVLFEQAPHKLTAQQRAAVTELKAIHAQVKNDPRITSSNAKGSLSEFVAEVMSNKKLQEQLRAKKWRMSDMLRGFKSVILRLLGIKPADVDTMLDASIAAVDALFVPSGVPLGVVETPTTRSVTAPNFVAETPPVEGFTEAPEVPRYAPKNFGVQGDKEKGFTFLRQRTKSDSIVGREPGIVDKFLGNVMGLAGRVQFIDQYAALSEALKKGRNAGQISSLEATNAEFLLRFGQQRSQYANQFLTNGPVQAEHTKKAGGVETVYRSTKGVNMVDIAQALNKSKLGDAIEQENMFTVYLAGDRAKQVGWDKLNFSDPYKAQTEYNEVMGKLAASPQADAAFKEAARLYKQYNAGLMDFLVQTGALSAKKAAELKAVSYVPFYRINKNGEVQLMVDSEHPVRIGNIKDEPQLQELVGGNTSIMPIFASAVQNTFMLTGMGLRNQGVKETSFALAKIGIASRVAPGKGPANSDVVRFKKNGEDWYALIDTDLYGVPADLIVRGMEGIKTTLPAIVKLMGMPANLLRSFVVRNPTYALRQVVRDPLNAWLTTGTDAMPVLSSMKELASMVAGRSEAERKLMATGAISSNVFSGDERDMAKFLKDVSAGRSGWDKVMAKFDAFALQGDAATRAVVYKDSLAKGMTEQEALLRTLESMNFSRRGLSPSMHALSVMVPFFNAQIQGLDVLYRAFKGDMPFSEQLKIKEKLMARGLMLAFGTLAYAAMMSDDEAYKRAKPEERYANWFVYVPGLSEPLRVPIPFELGYLFKALPEAVYNMAVNDEKASKALGGMYKLLEQSNPFSLPQAVKPLTEAVLGKSFFSGDIESAREKQVLATERYRDSSTEVAKMIGSVTGNVGVSPITVDYLIRGYTGPLGVAIVSLANPLLASDTRANIAQPSTKLSKTPFIGGLFQPVEGRGTLDEAYDRMQEIKQVKGTYNNMIERGQRAEAQAFAQEYAGMLGAASVSGAAQKQLGELAKQERIIRNHPTMTTEQKDERLERLDKIKMQIARNLLTVSDRTTRP